MNGGNREANSQNCYIHPKQVVIGICPLCLNEKLFLLVANQPRSGSNSSKNSIHFIPKIFSFPSFLSRNSKSDHSVHKSDPCSSSSQEGSFISIKFEENGAPLWEKGINAKVQNCKPDLQETKEDSSGSKSVIEHPTPRDSMRWQKRIGHLFHVIKRKRSSRGNACHVGTKPEGVKVKRKGWRRILTRKRTKE